MSTWYKDRGSVLLSQQLLKQRACCEYTISWTISAWRSWTAHSEAGEMNKQVRTTFLSKYEYCIRFTILIFHKFSGVNEPT